VRRIHAYNAERSTRQGDHGNLRINIGVTVGRHNHSRESLIRYARYFNELNVATVRFNNFADHGGRHPDLQLSRHDIAQVYRDLKWIHTNIPLNFQLGVSEDFGTFGIEVMNFPKHVGWCQAGRQLFTVIPTRERRVAHTAHVVRETVGDIVACVNVFEPLLGHLVRVTHLVDLRVEYELRFDVGAIEAFTSKRVSGTYENGCFARELMTELRPELTRGGAAASPHRRVPALSAIEKVS
jgi:hypothetical protein